MWEVDCERRHTSYFTRSSRRQSVRACAAGCALHCASDCTDSEVSRSSQFTRKGESLPLFVHANALLCSLAFRLQHISRQLFRASMPRRSTCRQSHERCCCGWFTECDRPLASGGSIAARCRPAQHRLHAQLDIPTVPVADQWFQRANVKPLWANAVEPFSPLHHGPIAHAGGSPSAASSAAAAAASPFEAASLSSYMLGGCPGRLSLTCLTHRLFREEVTERLLLRWSARSSPR
jgi:hypothetical protein